MSLGFFAKSLRIFLSPATGFFLFVQQMFFLHTHAWAG
jgi:hypothetical protein